MSLLSDNLNAKLPSIIKDPFALKKVNRIYVSYYPNGVLSSSNGPHCSGSIEFINGNTKGEQQFEGHDFDEVVLKMKAVLEELKA